MTADENSADSGPDHTPDETPGKHPAPEGEGNDSRPEGGGDDPTPEAEEGSEERPGPGETGTGSDEPDSDPEPTDEDAPETVVIDVDAPVATTERSEETSDGQDSDGRASDDRAETARDDAETAERTGDTDDADSPAAAVASTSDDADDADAPEASATDGPNTTDDTAGEDTAAVTAGTVAGEASASGDADGTGDAADGDTTATEAVAGTASAASPAHGDTPGDGSEEKSDGTDTASAAGGKGRKGRRRRLRRVVLWTAASLAVLMCLGAATAYGYYHSLRSGMMQHDIGSVLSEEDRPDKISDAVNILFIGSDGYEEDSPAYSQEFEGERSDSLMLAHISPDQRVSVISFPRDSLVQLPECDAYAQTEGTYGYFGMINAALYHGGPPCVLRTIESLTDIRVDHFVHLSFASFRDVVDAMGGVDMCIPEPLEDKRAKLDLDAGDQTLDGEQALSFVRARYDIGDGGDIGRIDRQQMFLAALADQVTSSDVLTSPNKLNGILQAVAQHSATDRELSLDRMLSIAVTMADVDLSDIAFHTVPWYQAPYDPNRVMWHEEDAAELFQAVREDRPLPELFAADDSPFPQEPPTASPTPADPSALENGDEEDLEGSPSARPGEGRDATSNPCQDGLGFGTGEDDW
ncbi:LCP family protein [Nocardiopsis sp. MG754419]|uniref:LCP family protein n=1 Tax=Nocardiopsis sp. MG754419 TaxID=2259865 RepID=UPI001BA7600C|nr:LCP family protein [Nocardiopsis sp. MG754419]MBR8742245.1 transcriptional regulator [Nocardiopsis sp. MG754419]